MNLHDLPLRERKAGQTRVSLTRALLPRLAQRPLDAIPVKELCAEVGISEPTFFNHFDGKQAVLPYYISLWSVGAAPTVRASSERGLVRIATFFDQVGAGMQEWPGVLNAILGHQHTLRALPEAVDVPRADRLAWYGDGFPHLEHGPWTVPELVGECVAHARARGELGPSVNDRHLVQSLLTLFYGVPAVEARPERMRDVFARSVAVVLRGHGL